MSGISLFSEMLNIDLKTFKREEILILEAEIFLQICKEIEDMYRIRCKEYFRLMRFNKEVENTMIETNFIRCLINDILGTENYTLSGIAFYTQIPEDVLCDLISGCIVNPTLVLSRRIIELHRSVRPELYRNVIKKMCENLLEVDSNQAACSTTDKNTNINSKEN